MSRNVKGALFVDYVKMIRANMQLDWDDHLTPGDFAMLKEQVQSDDWYPMDVFERLGNAILGVLAGGELSMVELWGQQSADLLASLYDGLLVPGDPRESMMRFNVLRGSFFDFPAMEITMLIDHKAHITVAYQMGETAEEAAGHQALGFFVRLLEASGASNVHAAFLSRSWIGEPKTVLQLTWA